MVEPLGSVSVSNRFMGLPHEDSGPTIRLKSTSRSTLFFPRRLSPDRVPGARPGTRRAQPRMKASRSALITSAWVVGMPCGNPG